MIPLDSEWRAFLRDPSKKRMVSAAAWSTMFFALQTAFQRTAGLLGMHAGYPSFVTGAIGLSATASNLYLSGYLWRNVESFVYPVDADIYDRYPAQERRDLIGKVLLGLTTYVALEGGFGRTALPSSSIAQGVFANARNKLHRSIRCTSSQASRKQRFIIQKLGRLHGCHQCGNRQLLSRSGFIADHMPPTKIVAKAEASILKQILNLKVEQRLWPQCQRCFQIQSAAVRNLKHVPIYHHGFRLYHTAPAIALLLTHVNEVRALTNAAAQPIVDLFDSVSTEMKDRWDSI